MKVISFFRAGACAVLVIATGVIFASSPRAQTAPRYEADLNWPKPLPDRWVLGGLGGQCVDAKGHVPFLNRQDLHDGDLHGGKMAPPLIEFDPAGNVVNSWGDLNQIHGISVDSKGNIYLTENRGKRIHKFRPVGE